MLALSCSQIGNSMVEELTRILMQFPYAGLFSMLVLGVILPLPEEATLMLCGLLIARGAIDPIAGLLSVYAGLLLSDGILYTVGRKFGRRLIAHPRVRRILTPTARRSIECKFRKYGLWLILFGRHIIGFRAKLFLVSGTLGISPIRFALCDAVAAAMSMTIMVTIGYTGSDLLHVLERSTGIHTRDLVPLAIPATLFILAGLYLRKSSRLT